MGQRTRKKRRSDAAPAAAPAPAPETESAYYARSRARDEAARASLKPLAPGERPRPVAVAAVIAALLAASNVVLYLAGWEVEGQQPQATGTILFSVLMALGAWFMWRRRYWAVLGFQALLAITMLFAFLALLTASNLRAAFLCIAIIGICAPLFWTLIRAMARLQLPRAPDR